MTVGIRRAHLEEDTARLVHAADPGGRRVSLVDFNRSGMPLMEIVTEPDLRTPEQARRYAEELRLLLRAIGASDAEMEQGQMRVEANVSIRPVGEAAFGTRAEVKNMNSFRSVERAIAYEVERQERVLDAGEPLVQETRGWDDDRGVTYTMRIKEGSDDYRYFPEPDLPPLRTEAARRGRYTAGLGLSPYDARVIVADAGATALFEETLAAAGGLGLAGVTPKLVANWVSGEYLRLAKQATGEEVELAESAGAAARVRPEELARLIGLVADGSLSGTSAKQVFERHFTAGEPVEAIVTDLGLTQISDRDALAAAVEDVIAANAAAVADYRAGRQQALGFLVGQVMRATRGRANAALVAELLRGGLDDGGTTG